MFVHAYRIEMWLPEHCTLAKESQAQGLFRSVEQYFHFLPPVTSYRFCQIAHSAGSSFAEVPSHATSVLLTSRAPAQLESNNKANRSIVRFGLRTWDTGRSRSATCREAPRRSSTPPANRTPPLRGAIPSGSGGGVGVGVHHAGMRLKSLRYPSLVA
jgi:hypothetical protein